MIKLQCNIPGDVTVEALRQALADLGAIDVEVGGDEDDRARCAREGYEAGYKAGLAAESQAEPQPLQTGERVEFADSVEKLGFNTTGPLQSADLTKKYPYRSIRGVWKYVRRESDGAIFGPDGKQVEA